MPTATLKTALFNSRHNLYDHNIIHELTWYNNIKSQIMRLTASIYTNLLWHQSSLCRLTFFWYCCNLSLCFFSSWAGQHTTKRSQTGPKFYEFLNHKIIVVLRTRTALSWSVTRLGPLGASSGWAGCLLNLVKKEPIFLPLLYWHTLSPKNLLSQQSELCGHAHHPPLTLCLLDREQLRLWIHPLSHGSWCCFRW